MQHLSMHFGISVACVHRIIHKIIPLMHAYLVKKYIKWPNAQQWYQFAGSYPTWPRVVGIIDWRPFRISKPNGELLKKERKSISFQILCTCGEKIQVRSQC